MINQDVVFLDKKGQVVNIGDQVISDADITVLVVSKFYVAELEQTVLFAQQIDNPMSFSYLTVDNLELQFAKVT